jgi:hypothetical protein
LTHVYVVRPTAKIPVGAGRINDLACSHHRMTKSAANAKIPIAPKGYKDFQKALEHAQ